MHKTLSIIFTCLSALLILDTFNFGHALMLFVLAGVIPGTNVTLSAIQTLELFALLMGVVLGRVTARLVISYRLARYFQPKAATLEV